MRIRSWPTAGIVYWNLPRTRDLSVHLLRQRAVQFRDEVSIPEPAGPSFLGAALRKRMFREISDFEHWHGANSGRVQGVRMRIWDMCSDDGPKRRAAVLHELGIARQFVKAALGSGEIERPSAVEARHGKPGQLSQR